MSTREAAVAEAMTWLGTPYHHMAAVKGAGVDCAQILIEVFSVIGKVPRIDVGWYPHDWHFHRSEEKYLGWIEQYAHQVETPKPGDIALYKFGRTVSHSAIVIDYPNVIHAYVGQGVILSDGESAELKGRLDSFWSLWSD
jgi:cell wall-associated NlpC family hydrolase